MDVQGSAWNRTFSFTTYIKTQNTSNNAWITTQTNSKSKSWISGKQQIDKQALIQAYSPHGLRSVGISNKSGFNTAKMPHFTRFNMSEFRPDVHRAFMVKGHYIYTKYE